MINPDSMARANYYKLQSTPHCVTNGKVAELEGGYREDAPERYKDYCLAVNKLLEQQATVQLTAAVVRKGDKIDISAKVQGLEKPGAKTHLRFVLVEDWVRYKGRNGLQYHHRVVRALPGGAKGVTLTEKASSHAASVDLDDLRKNLNDYLDDAYEGPRPLRLRNLHVVVFVQDDASAEVLQAVDVPVKEE